MTAASDSAPTDGNKRQQGSTKEKAKAPGDDAPNAPAAVPDADVHALRHFNRFYTRRVGVLGAYLGGDLTLTDVRVLWELAHAGEAEGRGKGDHMAPVASDIARTLGHDNGYLSRILKRFEARGWVQRTPNPKDGRQALLALTAEGRAAFAPLDARSHAENAAMLAPLSPPERARLIAALETVERLLSPPDDVAQLSPLSPPPTITATPATPRAVIRNAKAGDLGWIVQVHGEVYWDEYGWDVTSEALAAEIVASFARTHDPARERVFVADIDGERAGAVILMQGSAPTTAKIRLLCLAPNARGLGLGSRLVDECIAYAREKGYTKIELWTQSCLLAARRIYASRGFTLVASNPHTSFGGIELVGENWELELTPTPQAEA